MSLLGESGQLSRFLLLGAIGSLASFEGTWRISEEDFVKSRKLRSIIESLEPIADSHDLELVNVEIAGTTRTPVLRVFLDKVDGLTIDDIALANGWINAYIDEFYQNYIKNVSFPGRK